MSKNLKLTYKAFLVLGDVFSLLGAFTIAYILRIKFIDRPPAIEIGSGNFIMSVLLLLPLWLAILAGFGLYSDEIINKNKTIPRLILSSSVGVSLMISLAYFFDTPLFPAKLVTLFSFFGSFILMFITRELITIIYTHLLKLGYGCQRTLIVGETETTLELIDHLESHPEYGYSIAGLIGSTKNTHGITTYKSFKTALSSAQFDVIIDTNIEASSEAYDQAVSIHANYFHTSSQSALSNSHRSISILGDMPLVSVKITPLYGYGKFFKRLMDIVLGLIGFLLSLPILLVVIVLQKIFEPKAPVFFKQKRYSLHDKVVEIYKFRSMKQEFSGMPAEEAFTKMGRTDLIKPYYDNGQFLENDPRITKLGAFLRATSLDELPQFINVLKGDISFVGPRALPMAELDGRDDKGVILSVKSGLTGLAQVSGRRDISFDERRKIDTYYVQNWSLWLDVQIIFRTVWYVLTRRGAK